MILHLWGGMTCSSTAWRSYPIAPGVALIGLITMGVVFLNCRDDLIGVVKKQVFLQEFPQLVISWVFQLIPTPCNVSQGSPKIRLCCPTGSMSNVICSECLC
jgi:hypothetical protein